MGRWTVYEMPSPATPTKQGFLQCVRVKRRYLLASIGIFAAGFLVNAAYVHRRVLAGAIFYADSDDSARSQNLDVPPSQPSSISTIVLDGEGEITPEEESDNGSESSIELDDEEERAPDDEGNAPDDESDSDSDNDIQTIANIEVPTDEPSTANAVEEKKAVPPKSPVSRDIGVSACLLIKDDGDLLNEWIAYHYHALELRYLLVAVDPSSATSPTPIFDHWRRHTDMTIIEWADRDFMPADFLRKGFHIPLNRISGDAKQSKFHEGHEDAAKVKADNFVIANHRFRQLTFLSTCLRHMRDNHRTWTVHVDTDEFVVVNPLLRNSTQLNVQMIKVDPVISKSSILQVVRQFYRNKILRRRFNYPCICLPRLLFGSVETQDPDSSTTVSEFNTARFETLRWKYHTSYNDTDRNAQPKVIIDVSAVRETDRMFSKPFSIHRPSGRLCRSIKQLDFHQLQRYPITVNHYTGSWERYFLTKNDTRRSKRSYDQKAHVSDGFDDWMRSWLPSFVNVHGAERAKTLLRDYTITASG